MRAEDIPFSNGEVGHFSATTANFKTAVAGLLAWWKLHELAISDADSGELVCLLHNFIHTWLMQQATPTVLPEPTARTLLPAACAPPAKAELELEPRIYSCNEVTQLHNYQDSTIRRCAIKSWRQGPGPHPLRGGTTPTETSSLAACCRPSWDRAHPQRSPLDCRMTGQARWHQIALRASSCVPA